MFKTIKYVIVVLIVLFGLLLAIGYKACDLYDENSVLKGRDIEMTRQLEDKHAALKKLSTDNEKLIASLEQNRLKAEKAANEYTSAANEIKETFRTVGELKANAENDKALIVEMEIEINKRDEAINKLVLAIAEKGKEMRYMRNQYTALAIELRKTKLILEESAKLNILRAERIKALEKSLAKTRMGSSLRTGAIIGLAAVAVYGLVK